MQLVLSKGKVRGFRLPLNAIPKVYLYEGMDITVNDQLFPVSENCLLSELVFLQLGEQQRGIAVAVNHVVIPKLDWETYCLKANDQVLIIKATQGG